MKRFMLILALSFLPIAAEAQPYVYPSTIGTTPAQVLPANPARKRIIFHNPNATATIAFCPATRRDTGAAITCAVNGAGSITLLPGGSFVFEGGTVGGAPLAMPFAWNGVASAPSSAFSAFEFE